MFNRGDLVRVFSSSIDGYQFQNHTQKVSSYTSRYVQHIDTGNRTMRIDFRDEPSKGPGEIGEILDSIRGAVYAVKLNGRTVYCFPDELELAYTK